MSLELGPLTKYPCVSGVRGIDFAKVGDTQNRLVRFQGESGKRIEVCVTKSRVLVQDPHAAFNRYGHHMHNFVDDGTFCPEIVTYNQRGERHPDFYGTEFINATLAFFELNGLVISSWASWWPKGTRNYVEFYENLNQGSPVEKSCKATWSGKIAEKNGFSRVQPIQIDEKAVEVIFKR